MALNTYLLVPGVELDSRHPFGACNFEAAARVLENFSTPGSDNRLDKLTTHIYLVPTPTLSAAVLHCLTCHHGVQTILFT